MIKQFASIVIFIALANGVFGQQIDLSKFQATRLCELVAQEINKTRDSLNRQPLQSHPKLVKASQLQADYIRDKNRLSHTQPKGKLKDPFARVDYVGGEFFVIRENIAFHDVLLPIYDPKTKQSITVSDYHQLAKAFVREWIKSKGHFVNLSAKDITHVGTAVALDASKKRVFIVQVFGKPAH